jgi:hypothetical protein
MKKFSIIFVLTLIGGCAATPQIPPDMRYTPPSAESEALATIQGSQQTRTLQPALKAFIAAVDGKQVVAGSKGWNENLPVLPGDRRITVVFTVGVLAAQTELPLAASSGSNYELRFSSDVSSTGPNTYCDFWIIDSSTQKPVTEVRRGLIAGARRLVLPIGIFNPR